MRAADVDELLPIEEDLFGAERWTAGMFHSELTAGHHYLVARDDTGAVAGYAGLAVLSPDEAWINNLAVRRDAQRRGIGRALLEALLAEAARARVSRVLLEVAATNAAAQKLYAGHGFEVVSLRRGYYQPSGTDALVMVRERDFGGPGDGR
jgi:[ribosomal protein S18]-alanine N-acetyltransferase